jgi:hypothetical protein
MKIDPPQAELMPHRSALFKSENILSHFFCIESKEITFKELKRYRYRPRMEMSLPVKLVISSLPLFKAQVLPSCYKS